MTETKSNDQHPFETLIRHFAPHDVLKRDLPERPTRSQIRLLKDLCDALDARNWDKACKLRESALAAFGEARRPYLTYACAIAQMPGFAQEIAQGYAAIGARLAEHLSESILKNDPEDSIWRLNTTERLRKAYSLALAWLVIAANEKEPEPSFAKTAEWLDEIAAEIDMTLWTHTFCLGVEEGHRDALRTLKREEAEKSRQAAREKARSDLAKESPFGTTSGIQTDNIPKEGVDLPELQNEEEKEQSVEPKGVMVIRAVGTATTSVGKEVKRSVDTIIGKQVPEREVSANQLVEVRRTLTQEFPYATDLIDRLLSDLLPDRPIWFQPTALIGEPGGGKSRLVRRLLDEVKLPWMRLDAGSTADHALTGTARRWSTGHPSMPLALIEANNLANPAMIVDEIEKAGRSSSGSIHDALLSLLERSTAAAWHDPYVDTHIDVSHISWLFTCNELEGVPAPLKNRLRVLTVPRPRREHIPVLATQIMREFLKEKGIDAQWEPPLDQIEIDALTNACGDEFSVRELQRFVSALLAARKVTGTRN
jgi:hypothetical protein